MNAARDAYGVELDVVVLDERTRDAMREAGEKAWMEARARGDSDVLCRLAQIHARNQARTDIANKAFDDACRAAKWK